MIHLLRSTALVALGTGLAIVAACSPSPPQPPPPPPLSPTPAPAPPSPPPEPVTGWQDRELSPGTWVYRDDDRGSLALFGPSNAEATFVVRCELPARRIVFSRAGSVAGGSGTMAFATTAGARAYPASNGAGGQPYAVAQTSAQDGWLDELSFTRGRFSVAVPGQPLLVLPNWPQMIRVFEDCRGS